MVQAPFDLFKTEGADVRWIAAAPDLATAKEAAREIGHGKYLVLDQTTGNKFSVDPERSITNTHARSTVHRGCPFSRVVDAYPSTQTRVITHRGPFQRLPCDGVSVSRYRLLRLLSDSRG